LVVGHLVGHCLVAVIGPIAASLNIAGVIVDVDE